MKTNRKPDLLLILALFVLIGVLVSTMSQNDRDTNSGDEQDAIVPIRTQNNDMNKLYQSNYLRVSSRMGASSDR